MAATKVNAEDFDFITSIQKCNCDSPTSVPTPFPEVNVQDNCVDFPTISASVESRNIILRQETNNIKDVICKKKQQLCKSLMSITHPPTYRSLIMDFINDPPPDYTVVTGIVINVSKSVAYSEPCLTSKIELL